MGTDKKIRQNARAHSSGGAVLKISLAGKKQGGTRSHRYVDIQIEEQGVNGVNRSVTRRNFSIDHGIDNKRPMQGRVFKLTLRPIRPSFAIGYDVEQYV